MTSCTVSTFAFIFENTNKLKLKHFDTLFYSSEEHFLFDNLDVLVVFSVVHACQFVCSRRGGGFHHTGPHTIPALPLLCGAPTCWILDTFRMKQTQMYICTLEEFILDDLHYLEYKLELRYCMENTLVFIQSQQRKRNVRIALRWQLTV